MIQQISKKSTLCPAGYGVVYCYKWLTKFLSNLLSYIKNQQDATLALLFISHCKITLGVLETVVAATGACHESGW